MGVAAVILAAGGGTRFVGSTHKLLAELPGRPGQTVLGAVVAAALDARSTGALDDVFVVWGAVPLTATPRLAEVVLVHHASWERGQSGSVHAGLMAIHDAGHDVAVICPGDQPGVTAAAFAALADADAPLAAALYQNETVASGARPPVRLARSMWSHVPPDGDEGARSLMRQHPELVTLIPVPGDPTDIDTLEDLDRWN